MKTAKSKQIAYRKGRLASPRVEKKIPSAQPFNLKKDNKEQAQ